MLIAEIMARVIASENPRITRIYLGDEEYRQVMIEADAARGWRHDFAEDDRRVSLAGAMCYRLCEIQR